MIEKEVNINNEISLKTIISIIKDWLKYIKSFILKILLISLIGGCIGFFYAFTKSIEYSAKTTFILEEGKSMGSGLGGLASLAGQFGVDVGNVSGGGLLSGDNILFYFKSPSLAREVLLSKFDSLTNLTIADVYINEYDFGKKWAKNKKIGKVSFINKDNKINFSRLQDSLIQVLSEHIIEHNFTVSKVDKKAGFIDVVVTMNDELLAKKYCERIVQRVVEKYIGIKIQRQRATVEKLQSRVDSIATLLGKKTFIGASLQNSSSTMDINPLYKTQTNVEIESTIRDKTLLATIFASVTQNLEIAKFTLSQETPVIQIVDAPLLPLKQLKTSKLLYSLFGFLAFFLFTLVYIVLRRIVIQELS